MTHAPTPVAASIPYDPDMHPKAPAGAASGSGGQFTAAPAAKSAPAKKAAAKPAPKPAPKPAAKQPAKPAPKAEVAPATAITDTLTRKGPNDPGQVKALQRLLNTLKIANVAEDGQFGAQTEDAVKALQAKLGIRPTGHLSAATAKRMTDAVALSPCIKASAEPEFFSATALPQEITASASMPDVELARPGTWHLSSGKRTFTPENLRDAADFYAASGQARIPLGFGHNDSRFDGDPAFGWVNNIRYAEDDDGPVLLGDLVDMDDWVAAAAPQRWPNRSIEGFANLTHGDRTYSLALTRLALLGATPPAMPTLKSLADVRTAVAA